MELHALVDRVKAEFNEMPGLRLTVAAGHPPLGHGAGTLSDGGRGARARLIPALGAWRDHRTGRTIALPTCVSVPGDDDYKFVCCSAVHPAHRLKRHQHEHFHGRNPSVCRTIIQLSALFDVPARRRLRRNVRGLRAGAAPLSRAVRRAHGTVGARAGAVSIRGRSRLPDPGHHLHRLRRRPGDRAHLSLRPAAADHHRGRMAGRRARPHAAPDGHQPVSRRTSTTRAGFSRRGSCRAT